MFLLSLLSVLLWVHVYAQNDDICIWGRKGWYSVLNGAYEYHGIYNGTPWYSKFTHPSWGQHGFSNRTYLWRNGNHYTLSDHPPNSIYNVHRAICQSTSVYAYDCGRNWRIDYESVNDPDMFAQRGLCPSWDCDEILTSGITFTWATKCEGPFDIKIAHNAWKNSASSDEYWYFHETTFQWVCAASYDLQPWSSLWEWAEPEWHYTPKGSTIWKQFTNFQNFSHLQQIDCVMYPTLSPTYDPTVTPTDPPTILPSNIPTVQPTSDPTLTPTKYPTTTPTKYPSESPTKYPSTHPTTTPTQSTKATKETRITTTEFEHVSEHNKSDSTFATVATAASNSTISSSRPSPLQCGHIASGDYNDEHLHFPVWMPFYGNLTFDASGSDFNIESISAVFGSAPLGSDVDSDGVLTLYNLQTIGSYRFTIEAPHGVYGIFNIRIICTSDVEITTTVVLKVKDGASNKGITQDDLYRIYFWVTIGVVIAFCIGCAGYVFGKKRKKQKQLLQQKQDHQPVPVSVNLAVVNPNSKRSISNDANAVNAQPAQPPPARMNSLVPGMMSMDKAKSKSKDGSIYSSLEGEETIDDLYDVPDVRAQDEAQGTKVTSYIN